MKHKFITYTLLAAFLIISIFGVGPVLAQDGSKGKIVFASNRGEEGDYEIYVMDADGNNVVQLTDNEVRDGMPVWSPDGTQISFVSEDEIYVMNADGSDIKRLTNNTYADSEPSWSPDGNQIAFTSYRGDDHEIYIMNADGSDLYQYTDNSDYDYAPSWSPDGKKIAFICERSICVNDLNGNNLEYINVNGYQPSWSPDGTQIVLISSGEVGILNANSLYHLTSNKDDELDPSWSPDGTQIVFASNRDGDYEIYVMQADGTKVQQLTDNDVADITPDWSPIVESVQLGEIILTNESLEEVIATETVNLPNCSGVKALSISRTFTKKIARGVAFPGNPAIGAAALKAVQNGLKAHFGSVGVGESLSASIDVELKVEAGKSATYQIDWVQVIKSGLVEVVEGDEITYVEFSIVDELKVNVPDPVQSECE